MTDKILYGDVFASLNSLEDGSIAAAITSPPYWKQRDYGFEGQIGQEKTSEEYIGHLVVVFNKLKQKLDNKGIFFLNVGDKYLNKYGKSHLLQIPYRLAYHMVKDGWILEDIIIWFKPNHMPSSVKDRFANTYEPVLVFAKSKDNIYNKKNFGNVVKIPLQQTPWKHTAVYPEKLVEEMLNRLELHENSIVLDPFAGTGTTAVVVKNIRNNLMQKKIFSVMIEKGNEFIEIIQKRAGINDVVKVKDVSYYWEAVKEEKINSESIKEIVRDKHGEIFVAKDSAEFLSAIAGIRTKKFKQFHREDALYFFGVKNWSLKDLYYISQIYTEGYVLRNMLVISNDKNWYPIFMFARDSTKIAYKFYLDRIRIKPKTKEINDWKKKDFVGIKVRDVSKKETNEGYIVKVVEKYKDSFPKIVIVQWDGHASIEFVIHPQKDEFLMEGLNLICPKCKSTLVEPYDPAGENKCNHCKVVLWTDKSNIPIIKEPNELVEAIKGLENGNYNVGQVIEITQFETKKKTSSKFATLERINWGASPGARKLMLGDYFTKMRLYRIDQPTVAQFLTILRKSKGLSIQDIIDKSPEDYKHTVGHWFRKDFGGSTPIPCDVKLLKKILNIENSLLKVLERTALKFQTVKASIKGKNPGDFFEIETEAEIKRTLEKLFLTPQNYVRVAISKAVSYNKI
jgi:site-specific DNA-methyltransferase (adenine-specific)